MGWELAKGWFTVPELIALESHEAAKIFEDEISLFIDGTMIMSMKQDIEDWSPSRLAGYWPFMTFSCLTLAG